MSIISRACTLQNIIIVYLLWTSYLMYNWSTLLNYSMFFSSSSASELVAVTGTHGVNIYGWINGDFGGGRTARSIIKCLYENKVPIIAINTTGAELHTHHNRWVNEMGLQGNPLEDYPIDLFAINAANTRKVLLSKCNKVDFPHYRIGYWHWETSHLPPDDAKFGSFYHEIWVPSIYIADAIRATSTFPKEVQIQVLPYGYESYPDLEIVYDQRRAREKLPSILPDTMHYLTDIRKNTKSKLQTLFQRNALVFLMVFDFNSDMRRKNVDDAITAFKTAFPFPNNPDQDSSRKDTGQVKLDRSNVGLIIKTINSQHQNEDLKHLLWLMESDPTRIINIDGVMSEEGLDSLRSACDCYLSLHRSEGFGLNIMEAILAARPVIATAYSGSEQFFRPLYEDLAPELRIPATVVNIEHKFGPYVGDMVWGQPDVGAAVVAMREVQVRLGHYLTIAFSIRKKAIEQLSPANTGSKMAERLSLITTCLCTVRKLSFGHGKHDGCSNNEVMPSPTAEFCIKNVLGKLTNHTKATTS